MNVLFLKPAGYRGPLRLTSASKVREWPEQANGFSLPTIREVCVYATPTCWRGCYAKRGRMIFPTPQRAFRRNYDALVKAGTAEQMAELLIELFDWMKFSIVRIHVSGEFFSKEYTKAWALTCREYSSATFWSYTRSRDTDVLAVLAQIPNLRILLSCDRDNWTQMLEISADFPCFGLSYYSVGECPRDEVYARGDEVPVDNPIGLVVFPDRSVQRQLNLPGTCPTEVAVNPWPKEGACVKCRRCCGIPHIE